MKQIFRVLLLALLCLPLLGMAKKKNVALRFFVEANPQDTERFAEPIKLENPPREIYIEKLPRINERQIRGIYPFPAGNGTWGATFQLEESGRLDLEVLSTAMRGKIIVAFVATSAGTHQVANMIIDKPIHDGIITIPHGLTDIEIGVLSKEFSLIKPKQQGKKEAPTNPSDMGRSTNQ
jgi:hypothetical protein